jgi:hypothetical protein
MSARSKTMVKTFLRAVVYACLVFAPLVLLSSPRALAQGPNPFFTPPTFPGIGQGIIADLNGDGKVDLVYPGGVVLLGKGDGTFTTGTPWTSPGPTQIAVADFNGDGKQDIVLLGPLNQFSVFLGKGDGTFQVPVTTSIAAPPTSLVVGDLNGDGKPDVLAQVGSMFFTYLGKGDGTFMAGIASNAVDASTSDSFEDFNGDGKIYLFVFGQGIQLGNGDGTFQTLVPFTPTISGAFGIFVGDFDGDGRRDVFVLGGSSSSPQIQVLFGNGDGTFSPGPVQTLPTNAARGFWTVADLNGDGKDDLVGGTSDAIQVILGIGDGTFTPGKFYNAPGAGGVIVADFNGDHKKDIAVSNVMLFGNGDGTFQGDEATPGITGFGITGDFNGDGFPDLALTASSSNSNNSVLDIWLNDGKANFNLAQSYQIPVPYNAGGGIVIYSAIDINGDGKVDLVGVFGDAAGSTLVALLGNADGSFGTPISTLINTDMYASITGFTLGDVNGDGKPDVLLSVVGRGGCCGVFDVFLNNGDGTFSAPTAPFVGVPNGTVIVGDFNNDKKLDVIVGTTNGIAVALGNGDGTFQPTTFITNAACQTSCQHPQSGDFNGDGNLDLILSAPGGYQVLLGKGDGTFTLLPAANITGSSNSSEYVEQIADFNGDGRLDVLGSFSNSSLNLVLGNGDGTFGSPFSLPLLLPTTLNSTTLVADFNGDQGPDIALITADQAVWLFNNGARAAPPPPPPPPPPDFSLGAGSGANTATVPAGSTATYSISLAGTGGFTGKVALTCSVAPAGPACSLSPSSVTVSGSASATATVSVTTTARSELLPIGTSNEPDSPRRILWVFGTLLAAAGLIGLFVGTRVRPRRFSWSFATACGAILLLSASLISSGCGGGSNSPTGPGGSTVTGTTAGNYTVTVTAQSGSVSHNAQLTLTVH